MTMRVKADQGLCKYCGGKLRIVGTALTDNVKFYVCESCKKRISTKNYKEFVLISSRTKD